MSPNIIITTVVASAMMFIMVLLSAAITMPFVGSLIRLRSNYNPRAVGLEGTENYVGPKLNGIIPTLMRTYHLEGLYGLYKGAYAFIAMMSIMMISSVIFVGGTATKTPKGTWVVPAEGGVRIALFAIFLTFAMLPMAVILNRSVITPYKLPNNLRESLKILLSEHELSHPTALYKTPGLLAITAIHVLVGSVIAHFIRFAILGDPVKHDDPKPAAWRYVIYAILQATSAAWISPIQVVQTKLTVQPNLGNEITIGEPDAGTPESLRFAGTEQDVVGLRPTTDPYVGIVDATRKIIDEEGWQALYRGWWWTSLGALMAAH